MAPDLDRLEVADSDKHTSLLAPWYVVTIVKIIILQVLEELACFTGVFE